ncbi:MAG TPA: hypothetical protein VG944_03115 [Fimbriimonas sp.]|nr:hypothetical protein [Fimbriimonas sp.]
MALAELPYWQFVQMVRAVVIDRSEEPDAPRVKNRPVFESYRAVFDALNNPSEDETDEWLTRLPEAIL